MVRHHRLDMDCDNDPVPKNIPDIIPANNTHDQQWVWVGTYNRATNSRQYVQRRVLQYSKGNRDWIKCYLNSRAFRMRA